VAQETRRPRTERVRGRIDTVYHASPRFSAGKLRTQEGYTVRFAGPFFAREEEQVVLCGVWEEHPKFGRQLKVARIELDMPVDADGLANYLADHPRIKGIGPVRARRIAEQFGENFDAMISEQPEAVAAAAGLSPETLEMLREEWLRSRELNRALTWLASFGLTHHQVTTLVERFGNSAVSILQEDPYLILHAIRSLGFKRLDKIARQMGTPKDHPSRLRTGVMHCVTEAVDRGHSFLDYEDLLRQAHQLLVMDADDSDELIDAAVQQLIEAGRLACVPQDGRLLIAPPELLAMEEYLYAVLSAARSGNPHFVGMRDEEGFLDYLAPSLNEGQRTALCAAMRHRIVLLSGGAGSGKTYTVAAIAAMYEEFGKSVLLAAPTGKAAKRLEQVVGKEASTIHRMLGYDGEKFLCDAEHPLEADVVIVDELSVVDVRLAWHLFQAIDLDRTAVVLVGDHNQLPPVGPGHLLRDLIHTQTVPTIILDEIVRQAGVLSENSTAVLQGQLRPTAEGESGSRRPWYVVDEFQHESGILQFLHQRYPRLKDGLGFDLINEVQVLTPMRKGPLGVAALNLELQALVQKLCWGVEVPPPAVKRPQLLLHDRVIQNRNDYELGIMNGSLGTVIEVGPKPGELWVRFDAKEIYYEPGAPGLDDLSLAYALTVHKAQGSEFECSIVIVHKSHAVMLHRNWLYTAVTRAQRTAILIGDRWALRYAARERRHDLRNTFFPILAARRRLTT
jgi:exodeoxyribonuclease V alpha subunit